MSWNVRTVVRRTCAGACLATVVTFAPAMAQDISYKPIDPTFGGNPFNSAHLLGVANAQNDYKEPEGYDEQLAG